MFMRSGLPAGARMAFAFFLILVIAAGCSGGGGDGSSTGGGTTNGGDGGEITLTFNSSLLTSTTVSAGATTTVTVSGSSMRANALTQGGAYVNEIVFDSSAPIAVDSIATGDGQTLYYQLDRTDGSVAWSQNLPFPFWEYYLGIFSGDYALGAMLPIIYTVASSYPSGDYEFVLANPGSVDALVNVYQVSKTDPDFTSGALTVNLFVFTAGETNEVIGGSADAERVRTLMNQVFSRVGVTVGTVNLEFVNNPLSVILASFDDESMIEFLRTASKATVGRSDTGINCFLMPALPNNTLGIDGAIPGPGFLHGTSSSGIIAQVQSYGFTASGMTTHDTDLQTLAMILSHEIGHYLGLFHTTEGNSSLGDLAGELHDPLTDTPECGIENDTDGDGELVGEECRGKGVENLMFWVADFSLFAQGEFPMALSNQQGSVINTHPSVL